MDEQRFLLKYLAGSAHNTRKTVRSLYQCHFLPGIRQTEEPEMLVEFWADRKTQAGTPLGARTISKLMSIYRAWHKSQTGRDPDTAKLMKKVRRNAPRRIVGYWTPEQASAGLQAAYEYDDEIYDRMLFVMHTGVRKEEMFALTKLACLFSERASVVAICSDPITDVTKTGGARAIGMTPEVEAMLRKRCARLQPTDRVFGTQEFIERLEAVARIANIPKKRWHAMRHLYVTTLLDAGANLKDVSTAVGHSSITTTADIYWHKLAPRIDTSALPRRKGA